MLEYSFIPEVQRWIIGKKIVKDTDTLARCGVRGNDMPVFLYLVSAASIGLTPEETRRKYGHLLPHLLPQGKHGRIPDKFQTSLKGKENAGSKYG